MMVRARRRGVALTLVVMACVLPAPHGASAATCDMTVNVMWDGVPYRGTEALGIDRSGTVLERVLGDGHLMLRRPDGTLGPEINPYGLGSNWYTDRGILTPDGRVVGYLWNSRSHPQGDRIDTKGYYWDGTRTHVLKSRGAWLSYGKDVNRSGVVVGWADPSKDGDGGRQAVVWPSPSARPQPLSPLNGYPDSYATTINNHGRVYGYVSGAPEDPTRKVWVTWKNGEVRPLGFPARFNAVEVVGGVAAGYVINNDGVERPAFFGEDGLVVPAVPDGQQGRATEVTASGLYAGTLSDAAGNQTIFVADGSHALRYPEVSGHLAELRAFGNGTALASNNGRDGGWSTVTCITE